MKSTVTEAVQARSIEEYAKNNDLKGKKVLLRIDVNVSLGNNGVIDKGEDWRIIKAYRSIDFLIGQGAIVVVLSHIGREPKETLKPVVDYMLRRMPVGFIPSYEYELILDTVKEMQHGSVLMLENVRQHEGEKENDPSYLMPIIDICDIYVNDAFSVSHRSHASVDAVTKELPSFFGIQFVDEVKALSLVLETKKEVALVLGGAKFGTKLDLLKRLLPQVSYALIGGALANVFLKERGFEVGESYVDDSVDISSIVNNEKIILPVDCVDQDGDVISIDEIHPTDMILDIGHETEQLFETIIAHSGLVLWNGPMGKYEDGYTSGSLAIAQSLAHAQAYTVTGGGDTAAVVLQDSNATDIDFISTGGGAMLDFLVEGTINGIEAIVKK